MGLSNLIDGIIKTITGDKAHVYRGKSGSYLKSGGQKSGRKGTTLLFKWGKK